jgi:protein disulfide-isomerase A6
VANEIAKSEEYIPTPEDIEIEEKQEAQRIALAHGGFTSMVDFEKAIKEAAARGGSFHGTNMKNLEKLIEKHGTGEQKTNPEGAMKGDAVPVGDPTEQIVLQTPITAESSETETEKQGEPPKDEL